MTNQRRADPGKDLVWRDWAPGLLPYFFEAKKGITEESMLAQGCKMATYKRHSTVIVWPIIGADLDVEKPVGYVIMHYAAKMLPRFDRQGNKIGEVAKKLTFGSMPGLIGLAAINKLKQPHKVELVWKVEGITDQAALWAAIPPELRDRHVVVTTSNGAGEAPDWRADLIAQFDVNVIHDCDIPGQQGAHKWAEYIASKAAPGKIVRNILLPFEVVEDHGKDLRDYLIDG